MIQHGICKKEFNIKNINHNIIIKSNTYTKFEKLFFLSFKFRFFSIFKNQNEFEKKLIFFLHHKVGTFYELRKFTFGYGSLYRRKSTFCYGK